jgi:hypothetical protein
MEDDWPEAMSDFFEPPPPPPPEERIRHRPPAWSGPPHGTLPGVVPLELVLARSEVAAVYISRLSAYPTGVEFDLVTIAAPDEDDEALDPMLFGPHGHHMRRRAASTGIPDEMLRFGVEFADGRRATNTGGGGFSPPDTEPAGPVLHPGGGGGGGGRWHQVMFLWPLPPQGRLALVCEWPAAGIPLTRTDIDAGAIHEAAQRAQVIFEDHPRADAPGSTWSTLTATRASESGGPPPQPHAADS